MKVVVIKKYEDYEWGTVALIGQLNDEYEVIQFILAKGLKKKYKSIDSYEWDSGEYYLMDLASAMKEYKRMVLVNTREGE